MPSSKSFPRARKVSQAYPAVRHVARAQTMNHRLRTIRFRPEKLDQGRLFHILLWLTSAGMSVRFRIPRGLTRRARRSNHLAGYTDRNLSCYATHLHTLPPHTRSEVHTSELQSPCNL